MSDKFSVYDRQPAVAGQFYPASTEKLEQELNALFADAAPREYRHVRAIISPHAGYVFSGVIAASAFNQIDDSVSYKHVFVIGSSHRASFKGAAVYCDGDFLMPYGKEQVDTGFGKKLVELHPDIFTDDREPHMLEHSIEVQLPFLHHVLKGGYKIVPILLGSSEPKVCKQIALALKPYLNEENLFVISTDFSHYPGYDRAKSVDLATERAIMSNDPKHLLVVLAENAQKHIPNLATSLCGWPSVLTLLYMTENNHSLLYQGVKYSNSGDAEMFGDRNQVVGYWAIAVTEAQECKGGFSLTEEEKQRLLHEARGAIEKLFRKEDRPPLDLDECSSALKGHCGAFVSLHKKDGSLRGCIGQLTGDRPLVQTVRDKAVWAAIYDSRFPPVKEQELKEIDIEISVLSPLRLIEDISEIELGVHGVYLVKGFYSGVFLPQVATETGWDKETFLGHCARDKAGIGWEGWKDAEIYIFTATIFGEKEE